MHALMCAAHIPRLRILYCACHVHLRLLRGFRQVWTGSYRSLQEVICVQRSTHPLLFFAFELRAATAKLSLTPRS